MASTKEKIRDLQQKLKEVNLKLEDIKSLTPEERNKKTNGLYEKWKQENQWQPSDPTDPLPEPDPEEPIPEPEPTPQPEEPPATGVLWDSNRDGKWNAGNARTVEDREGDTGPNGKGFYTAASGNPKLVIDGDGVAHLVTGSGECEDLSLKLRSRHQEGGDCANRFGGFGCSVDRKEVGMKTESCHNNHENSKSASHGISIKNNEWHKVRFECKDGDNAVNFECFIDGDSKLKHSHKNPAPAYVNKASFAQNSYFWIRSNNADHGRIYVCATNYDSALELEFKFDGGNSIGLRNVQLIAL